MHRMRGEVNYYTPARPREMMSEPIIQFFFSFSLSTQLSLLSPNVFPARGAFVKQMNKRKKNFYFLTSSSPGGRGNDTERSHASNI